MHGYWLTSICDEENHHCNKAGLFPTETRGDGENQTIHHKGHEGTRRRKSYLFSVSQCLRGGLFQSAFICAICGERFSALASGSWLFSVSPCLRGENSWSQSRRFLAILA